MIAKKLLLTTTHFTFLISIIYLFNGFSHITPVTAQVTPVVKATVVEIGKPKQLIIPSININTKIEHIGLTAEGAIGVPEGAINVSWFSAGPMPGQKGSAVISGHSGIWKDGTHSIFDPLPNMKAGDIIYGKDDKGETLSFKVKAIRVYGKDETVPEIFNKSDRAYLNIITCHGDYLPAQKTYSKRLVVFAEAT